jgi:hypothetical protein
MYGCTACVNVCAVLQFAHVGAVKPILQLVGNKTFVNNVHKIYGL